MKRIVILLLLVVCCFWLGAYTFDEALDMAIDSGGFVEHNGYNYFISSTIMSEDGYYGEDDAVQFVAQTAFVFMLAANEWYESDSSNLGRIKDCDKIACPYSNGYQDFLLEIPTSEAYDVISFEDYDENGDSRFYDMKSYIRSYGDHRNLDFWLEE